MYYVNPSFNVTAILKKSKDPLTIAFHFSTDIYNLNMLLEIILSTK